MHLFRTAACAAFAAAACPAAAQSVAPSADPLVTPARVNAPATDTSFTVGSVVVTGTRLPRSSDAVLTSVDVLGGDLAQRQSVDNTWELFARLPGVTLTDFNQGNTSGRFSIRGFNGEGEINAVKLLIDGIPSNANDGGMVFIDSVMPLDIAAVELVRGTADPRYGLHNIAGNANILTRIGGSYLDAKALAGAFGTYEGQVSAGVERGGFSQNYFVGYRDTDGFRDHADLRRANVAGKWFYDFGSARIGAIARYSTAKAEEPGYLTAADNADDRSTSYSVSETDGGKRRLGQYSLHLDADVASDLSLSAKGYVTTQFDDRYVRFSANVAQQRRLTEETQVGGLLTLRYRPEVAFLHDLQIEAGGDVQVQDNQSRRWLTDRRVLTRQTRDQDFDLTVYGGYVQAVIEPTAWLKITPAWRFDRVSGSLDDRLADARYAINDYGTISQPKLSVAVTPIDGLTAYANYGRTFQIGAGSGAYKVPPRTSDLAPSINTGWEAGVKYVRGSWLEGRVALWRQTATGEIKRRLNDPNGDFDNLGETRRQGIDVQLNLTPVPGVSLWGAYSYQHARIRTPDPATPSQAGNWIDHVPQNLFSGGLDLVPAARWRVSLWGNGQSSYELTPANDRGRFGDYVVVTGEVAFELTPRVELSAQVKNLGNERYEYVWWDGTELLHAPADPRAVYGAVRVRL
ncbi:TonB-dependent receptor [Sphingomonas sp. PL-96]|uniref:TonB-dependent receptor n=1 Tax=Sphingomonas sp. PL-96 TaxID=2887201 RepID=UPI001E43E47C|nr:TonB-dependent receptor [Sphingomonas sp. PL-96]MCC2976806.1 TonB-dependent receptor [Sphingomonas sp. PL-96]